MLSPKIRIYIIKPTTATMRILLAEPYRDIPLTTITRLIYYTHNTFKMNPCQQ